jgi:23S rRNA pseudouridine2605 synthase
MPFENKKTTSRKIQLGKPQKKTVRRPSAARGAKSAAQQGGGGTRPKAAARPKRSVTSVEGGVRLNKYLADHGVASRRAADELIQEGHIHVDGVRVEELGLRVDPSTQLIELDGAPLESDKTESKQYYLLNKPAGVVCTNERRETRPRAVDLVTDRNKGRIYTVGRLDEESKGLILLTNDGDFANRIMHPSFGVTKTYMVKVRGRITDEAVQRVREGAYLSEGKVAGARVVVSKRTRDYSHLQVTLREGKNREIRRVFHSVGFKVVELKRSRIGMLNDKGLKIGYWRHLTRTEIEELMALSAGEEVAGAPKGPEPRRGGRGGRGRASGRGRSTRGRR